MDKVTVDMESVKTHSQTIQYKAIPKGMPPALDRVYIATWALGNPHAKKVRVTIEELPE
jgi:hypothetical protein